MGVTREVVEACYREILGREPESGHVVDEYVQEGISVEELRHRMAGSPEFLFRQEEAEREKMLVYGAGDHLQDMLNWHKELGKRIGRVFDKNPEKIGTLTSSGQVIEPPENLRQLAPGTRLAIAAIRYYADIVEEVRQINPGIRCLDIDDAYQLPDKSWMPCADNRAGSVNIVKNDTQATMTEKSIFVKCLASRLRLEVEHEKMRRAIALSWHTEIAQ